jgi:hypothetical protein
VAAVHPILSIGLDLPLLLTRAALLQRAGYSVITASPDTPSLDMLLRKRPAMVLICHTIKGEKLLELMNKSAVAGIPALVVERGPMDPEHLLAQVVAATSTKGNGNGNGDGTADPKGSALKRDALYNALQPHLMNKGV